MHVHVGCALFGLALGMSLYLVSTSCALVGIILDLAFLLSTFLLTACLHALRVETAGFTEYMFMLMGMLVGSSLALSGVSRPTVAIAVAATVAALCRPSS